jgi:hypothetical protein
MGAIKGCKWIYRETANGYETKRVDPSKPTPDSSWIAGRIPMTDEHKEKLRIVNTGRMLTPEWKAKIGAAHKGVPKSLEHRAAMSKAVKGIPRPYRRKSV